MRKKTSPEKSAPEPQNKKRKGNPFGRGNKVGVGNKNALGFKQIFGTRDPWKQAVIRICKEAQGDPHKRAMQLDEAAKNLMLRATKRNGPMKALELLAVTLDGRPQATEPPPQMNTLNVILNMVRGLNLTEQQIADLSRRTISIESGSSGVAAGDCIGSKV